MTRFQLHPGGIVLATLLVAFVSCQDSRYDLYDNPWALPSGEHGLAWEDDGQESDLEFARRLLKRAPLEEGFRDQLYNHPDPFGQELSYSRVLDGLVDRILWDEEAGNKFLEALTRYMAQRQNGVSMADAVSGYELCVLDYSGYVDPVVEEALYTLYLRLKARCDEASLLLLCEQLLNLTTDAPPPVPDWARPRKFFSDIHFTFSPLEYSVLVRL